MLIGFELYPRWVPLNQRFQAIEFVERAVPEKLDIVFLFCVLTVKYKATRIYTSVTHT